MRWLTDHTPQLVLIPTIAVTIAYVILFSVWTLWMSVSNSTLLPDTTYAGFGEYVRLWTSRRWTVAYQNLFLFGSLYVIGSELDWVEDLTGSYFRVKNPNASSSCGCGTSFAV